MSKMRIYPQTPVRVAGQLTITGRVQLIAEYDYPKLNIKKGQKVGKTINKNLFYAMPKPKTVMR